ncbi:MAG: hypothetical protein U0231_11315 [Nitrospiraceae bacterium]
MIDAGDDYGLASQLVSLPTLCVAQHASRLRSMKVALLGSYTTTQFGRFLRFALSRLGIIASFYESHYGQFQQDIIDAASGLYAFAPDIVVLAVQEGDLRLPQYLDEPEQEIRREVERWTALWRQVATRSAARSSSPARISLLPCEVALGHLSVKLPGSRYMMTQFVNAKAG